MPDSTLFDGTDDKVLFDAGVFTNNGPDAFSMFCVVKRASSTTYDGIAYAGEVNDGGKFGISIKDADDLLCDTSIAGGQGATEGAGSQGTATTQHLATDSWVILGYTKPAGETATCRFHKWNYATEAWAHEPAEGGGTVTMNSVTGVIDEFAVGCWKDVPGFADYFHGNIGLIALWDSDIGNDAAVEALLTPTPAGAYTLQNWVDAAPVELLRFDGTTGISALLGDMVEQSRTGTTTDTGDMPGGWDDTITGGGTPQTVFPDADTTTTGWTSTPLFSKINDSSDATIIQATLV